MKKSFLFLVLFLGFHTAWGHDAEIDGIFYNLTSWNKTATVTFKGEKYNTFTNEYAGDVVIPESITVGGTTYSVTSLGYSCFRGCSAMTSIIMLPTTPPSAGDKIFYNTPMETVYVVDEDAKTRYQAKTPWNAYEVVVMEAGIDDLKLEKDAPAVVGCYNLSGKKLSGKPRGIVVKRYADGSTRKVMVK